MDQPFRFSLYLRRIGQHWKLIVIPTVIALVAAIVFSLLIPVRYTATTTMIAPKQQLAWTWDYRVHDVVDLRFDWRSEVTPLVKTKKVASMALEQVGEQLSREYTPDEVISATAVKPGAGEMFSISVTVANPNDAALLANALAGALPSAVADIYASQEDAFDEATDDVTQSFQKWDEKWRQFRAQYGIDLGFTGNITGVGDQLYGHQSAIKQELTLKSSQVGSLTVFLDHIATVLAALNQNEADNHLALLNSPLLENYGLDFTTLQQLSPHELAQELTKLQAQVQSDVDVTKDDLLALQNEVAALLQERENILRERSIWYDSVKTLENKQVEMKVKRTVEGQRVQQVDTASVPNRPSQPNWPLNLALALVAGLLGGLFLAVIAVYLGGEDNSQT